MRLLLDTHTFLWLMERPDKLSAAALQVCDDLNNDLFLSVASLWEMQVKQQLGKLPFDRLLIAQAHTERMTLVSADSAVQAYVEQATILR